MQNQRRVLWTFCFGVQTQGHSHAYTCAHTYSGYVCALSAGLQYNTYFLLEVMVKIVWKPLVNTRPTPELMCFDNTCLIKRHDRRERRSPSSTDARAQAPSAPVTWRTRRPSPGRPPGAAGPGAPPRRAAGCCFRETGSGNAEPPWHQDSKTGKSSGTQHLGEKRIKLLPGTDKRQIMSFLSLKKKKWK